MPTRRMRIAHLTATFPPYWGGTGNVAWHNAREIARLGHAVHVFTAGVDGVTGPGHGGSGALAPEGVVVHRLKPVFRVGNAPLLPALLPALRGFDLVHVHYPFYFGAEMAWAAWRLYGVPYVLTYHNDVVFHGPLAWLPPVHHALVARVVLGGARRVIFTTRDYGETSRAAAFARSPRATDNPIGVDATRFRPGMDGSAVRRAHGIAPEAPLALFVGGLDRAHFFKGLDVLLEALATARRTVPDLRLLVVGDGDLRAEYERTAARLGLNDAARFAGRVEDAALPDHYAAADFLVLPSVTRGEAFGVVLLEAMAAGKPVIASDLPGVRVVVRETGGGLLVPPGDAPGLAAALAALAQDPVRRRALGEAGRRAVEQRYTWSAIGERLEAIYRDVLAERWTDRRAGEAA